MQYNYTITVKDGEIIILTNSVTKWGGSDTPEATNTSTIVPGDSGIPIANISYTHKGYFIASNNKLYATRSDAIACTGNEPYAVVAVVGALDYYFDKFLALACEDAQNSQTGWLWPNTTSDAYLWAQNHPITISGVTYNTINPLTTYDAVADDKTTSCSTRSSDATKGWRVPSVTDWRQIFTSFATTGNARGSGIANNQCNSIETNEGKILCNAINEACGNYVLDGHYWTSSALSTNSNQAWMYMFMYNRWQYGYKASSNPRVRLVFAY